MITPALPPPRRIVLINGVYGAPEHFAELRERLAPDAVTDVFSFRKDRTPDPRGEDGFEAMAGRLEAFLDGDAGAPVAPPPVLIGFSLGGALALEYATRPAARLSALILVNAFARFEGSFLQVGTIPALHLWPNRWTHPGMMARTVHGVDWMRRGLFHPDASLAAIEHSFRAAARSMSQEDVRFQLAHLLLPEPEDLPTRLAPLGERLPVLLISSREDVVVPPRHTERLAIMMPGAERLPPFEGGHAFFQHDARMLAEAIRGFLDRRVRR